MHITKLAKYFARKLAAIEDCPDCGGLGYESEDKYSDARGHYTVETVCPTCEGEGTIGEEEDIEWTPEEKAEMKERGIKAKKLQEELEAKGLCLACKGTGRFLGWKDTNKICQLCGGSGKNKKPGPAKPKKIKNPYWTPPGSGY